nr:AMP-binding protein [Leptolyngbyaceae cyanobacterium MO_188.B28]
VRARTLEQFSSKYASSGFKPQAFYPCYGMAEATLLISSGDKSSPPIVQSFDERALNQNQTIRTDRNQPGSRLLVSCGHSWMGGEIRIVNPETLTACSAREVGEIWVRGSGIGKGYWNHPKETKEVFQAYLLDTGEGPFLRTGDLGCLDHGELFVTGRLKEVIKLWGRGIYPQQLEESLENRHSAFLGCAAFSVEKDGAERIVIAQELDRQTCRTLTPQQVKTMIKQICRTLLIRHLVDVYAIAFLKPGGLPKTSSGKVQRRRCQTLFLTGELPAIEQWICPAKQRFNYARWCTWAFRLDKFNLLSKVLNL